MWGTCAGVVEVAWYAAAVKESQINVRKSNNKELQIVLKTPWLVSSLVKG